MWNHLKILLMGQADDFKFTYRRTREERIKDRRKILLCSHNEGNAREVPSGTAEASTLFTAY